jgi:CheY-like chemotaxis protein
MMSFKPRPDPLHILYVEDNALVRESTEELLQKPGRALCICASAEDAVQALRDRRFDLVITDVSLPVMSGIDLARHILARSPQAAIIIASGYQMDAVTDALGPNVRAIIKPIMADEIDALIDALI